MICIISPTYNQAFKWAHTQNLSKEEWFYALEEKDLWGKINFHVIVIGEFESIRSLWFEKIYSLAKSRGRIGRHG